MAIEYLDRLVTACEPPRSIVGTHYLEQIPVVLNHEWRHRRA
jgi:hypothetical protein